MCTSRAAQRTRLDPDCFYYWEEMPIRYAIATAPMRAGRDMAGC